LYGVTRIKTAQRYKKFVTNKLFLKKRRNIILRCYVKYFDKRKTVLLLFQTNNITIMGSLYQELVTSLLPAEIYQHFQLVSLTDKPYGLELRLEEKSELIPSGIDFQGSIVLDGFCNPLELLHFSLKGKPLYLRLYRRRWKESGSAKHYSNHYDLHPEGVKATHEFAAFLKGEVGCTADEYVRFLLGTEP